MPDTDQLPTIDIPSELPNILKDYAKFIIKNNPPDIIEASAVYFSKLHLAANKPAGKDSKQENQVLETVSHAVDEDMSTDDQLELVGLESSENIMQEMETSKLEDGDALVADQTTSKREILDLEEKSVLESTIDDHEEQDLRTGKDIHLDNLNDEEVVVEVSLLPESIQIEATEIQAVGQDSSLNTGTENNQIEHSEIEIHRAKSEIFQESPESLAASPETESMRIETPDLERVTLDTIQFKMQLELVQPASARYEHTPITDEVSNAGDACSDTTIDNEPQDASKVLNNAELNSENEVEAKLDQIQSQPLLFDTE